MSPAIPERVRAGAQSQGLGKSQVYLCSGPPLGTRGTEACPLSVLDPLPHLERQRECQTSTSPTALLAWRAGVKSPPPLENNGGCTVFNKTEKTVSTENVEFKGTTILFVEDTKGPRYIREPHVHICPEVQGVSEVCLNTNRISGQYPVRRDVSQTQGVGNRLKKKHKKQNNNRCQHRN